MGAQASPSNLPDADLKAAKRFLDVLDADAEEFCFQTFDDVKLPDGKPRKDARLVHLRHGSLGKLADKLRTLNEGGAGVFVAVNETDGKGRKAQNIVRVRGVTVDLDGAPLAPVRACRLKPHLIVESSPDKFHVYWLVKGLPLAEFEDVQRAIAKRFDGDPSVALLTHVARVPGFYHNKEQPFRTRIIAAGAHDAYDADDILAEFPPETKPHKPAGSAGSAVVLPIGVPMTAAREFVREHFFHDDVQGLYRYRGTFYDWQDTHFKEHDPQSIKSMLYAFLEKARVLTEDGTEPFNPTSSKVNQIIDAVEAMVYLGRDRATPFWLPPFTERTTEDLIACRNGLLNIETRKLRSHSLRLFNVNCLPYDYDPDAPTYPPMWMEFLRQLWPGDGDGRVARRMLQEIFGLMLTPDTCFQKLFLVIGPKRSGKGTIGRVLTALLGKENVASPTLAGLSTNFGLAPLIDKRCAIISDARLGPQTNVHAVAERLLSISGEDSLTIDRKYLSHWTGRMSVRFLILTNELPRIADASGALPSRFELLKLTQSFYGREDLTLTSKLLKELPGILNWSLRGLERLRERGHFEMPDMSREAIEELEHLASPVREFVNDWCVVGKKERISKDDLYQAWKAWCDESGHRHGSHIVFGRNLRAAFPEIRPTHSKGERLYDGIALSADGVRDEAIHAERVRMRRW
jgi:putative DNA primase/helicase